MSGVSATDAAEALRVLLDEARLAAPCELVDLVAECARSLGARGATIHLADLQQALLVPLAASTSPEPPSSRSFSVDSTLAGRAFQTYEIQRQDDDGDGPLLWLPLLVGEDRIGVLGVSLGDLADLSDSAPVREPLVTLARMTAQLLTTKQAYSDEVVRLRRTSRLGLAAELQYSLLPPLSFTSRAVSVTAALEPCYEVAGDSIDYAVDTHRAHVAVFDGMGHGLHSAQCAVLTVGAYRNARRSGSPLRQMLVAIDDALVDGMGGEIFTTAVLGHLDAATGLFEWVNAGHPEPLLLRNGRLVKSLHVEPRPPLGLGYLLATDDASVGSEQLEPGDFILLFTDGVVEARSPDGEFFGIERLTDLVLRQLAGGLSPTETMRRTVRELLNHQHGQLSDDASLLLIGWQRPVPESH
jgi:serine phosphatase RsbU (regulator of sigma subunit)